MRNININKSRAKNQLLTAVDRKRNGINFYIYPINSFLIFETPFVLKTGASPKKIQAKNAEHRKQLKDLSRLSLREYSIKPITADT